MHAFEQPAAPLRNALVHLPASLLDRGGRAGRAGVRSFRDDAEATGTLTPALPRPKAVPVRWIVGSVGRAQELRPDFRPKRRRQSDDDRYQGVLRALTWGVTLPPVDLYKLGPDYYVLDGNHRVAAARELGQVDIDAVVTEYLPADDEVAMRHYVERSRFERSTGLTRILASRPTNYAELERHIREFALEKGLDLDDGLKAAASRWYDTTYYPTALRLRFARMRGAFPGTRSADVFVELARFRKGEQERGDRALSWSDATDRFLSWHGAAKPHGVVRLPMLGALIGLITPDQRRASRN